MSLLYERDLGWQMNPLQIEQMMMSSFPLSSILHATGVLLLEYPYTLRLSRLKQVTSTGKNKPMFLFFMSIAAFQESCGSFDFDGRWPCVN